MIDSLTDRLRDAAVAVSVERKRGSENGGLGLIIGRSGAHVYIATARHVVARNSPDEAAASITVRSPAHPGHTVRADATVVGPPEIDLAFFRMRLPDTWRFAPSVLAPQPTAPRPGDPVWTLEHRGALGWRVNPAEGRIDERIPSRREWIVSRLPVIPAVSGAPLMTASGVIGLVISDGTETGGSRALDIALVAEEARRLGLPWDLTDRPEERVRIWGGRGPLGARDADLETLSRLLGHPVEPSLYATARPARDIVLRPFEIDATEVSWAAFEDWGRVSLPDHILRYRTSDNVAVVGITWTEADAYCRSRGGRLPTEAEWERAARGPEGFVYPWGNTLPEGGVRCADCAPGEAPTGPGPIGAASEDRTANGIRDLASNVREWVQDWYAGDAYARAAPRDPEQTDRREARVVRGGSWFDPISDLAAFRRGAERPDRRDPRIGFRCAQNATDP